MSQPASPPERPSRRIIRWIDYAAMLVLAAVVVYRFFLPHPSAPLPAHGTAHVATSGKPVLLDLSSTI